MIVLAIDTSGPCADIALRDGGERLATTSLRGAAHHSETLIGALDALLAHLRLGVNDIDLFACATGPGSFTGLRIGMATVLGLAEATGKPAIGVTTLEAMAFAYLNGAWPVAACLDARRGQIYAQVFRGDVDAPDPRDEPRAFRPADFAASLTEPTLVIGDGADAYADVLRDASNGRAVPVAPRLCYHPAESVAVIAERRIAAGASIAPLAPLYVRSWDAAGDAAATST